MSTSEEARTIAGELAHMLGAVYTQMPETREEAHRLLRTYHGPDSAMAAELAIRLVEATEGPTMVAVALVANSCAEAVKESANSPSRSLPLLRVVLDLMPRTKGVISISDASERYKIPTTTLRGWARAQLITTTPHPRDPALTRPLYVLEADVARAAQYYLPGPGRQKQRNLAAAIMENE